MGAARRRRYSRRCGAARAGLAGRVCVRSAAAARARAAGAAGRRRRGCRQRGGGGADALPREERVAPRRAAAAPLPSAGAGRSVRRPPIGGRRSRTAMLLLVAGCARAAMPLAP